MDVATGALVDGPIDRARYSPIAWLPGGERYYYVRRLDRRSCPPTRRSSTAGSTCTPWRPTRPATSSVRRGLPGDELLRRLGEHGRPLAAGHAAGGHRAPQRGVAGRPRLFVAHRAGAGARAGGRRRPDRPAHRPRRQGLRAHRPRRPARSAARRGPRAAGVRELGRAAARARRGRARGRRHPRRRRARATAARGVVGRGTRSARSRCTTSRPASRSTRCRCPAWAPSAASSSAPTAGR